MKREAFHHLVEHRIVVCQSILEDRAGQYATGDRLWNFKRAANTLGQPVPMTVVGMMSKHLVSVLDMAQGIRVFTESDIHEKFTDLHNYLYLLEATLAEALEQQELREAQRQLKNQKTENTPQFTETKNQEVRSEIQDLEARPV